MPRSPRRLVIIALAAGLASVALLGAPAEIVTPSAAARASNPWSLRPATYSVSYSDNGLHGVSYPMGAVRTEDTDPGVRLDGARYGDRLELRLLKPMDTEDRIGEWWVRLGGDLSLLTRPGVYRTESVPEPGELTLDLTSSCASNAAGRVDILDVALDDSDRISRMWFRYEFGCGNPVALMTGEVRWGYPEQPVEGAPTSVVFPATQPGAESPMAAVLLHKSPGTSYSPARLVGADADSFEVAADECQSTDAAAPDCATRLRFRPSRPGAHSATLVSSNGDSTVRTPLEGRGLPGTFRIVLDNDAASMWGDRDFDATPGPFQLEGAVAPKYPNQESFRASFWAPATGTGFDMEFTTAPDRQFDVGNFERVASDWPTSEPTIALSSAQSDTVCSVDSEHGRWTVNQALRGRAPAYDVEFQEWCGDQTAPTSRGHIWYGARDDVTGPVPASRLRRTSARMLAWDAPADAVRSVVRARGGGAISSDFDTGELVYSGPCEQAKLPRRYNGKSVSYTLFTFDAAGNVSAPSALLVRGPSSATLQTSTREIGAGQRLGLAGVVTDAGWGHRLGGRTVRLQKRPPGGRWVSVATTTSTALGRYAFSLKPPQTRDYRVRVPASTTHLATSSPVRRVTVP